MQALKEAGMEPDIVAGCSMGALVGGAFAAGWLDDLEEWAVTITRRDIVRFLDLDITTGGLIDGTRIMEFLQGFKGDFMIEDLDKPYIAIASELYTGRELWMREGSIFTAIRASVSIPGFLRPYKRNEKWLLDGGLTNPVPVSACRALGADVIIAVNPNASNFSTLRLQGVKKKHRSVQDEDGDGDSHAFVLDRLLKTVPEGVKSRILSLTPDFLKTGAPDTLGYGDVVSISIEIMTDQIMRNRLAGDPPDIMLAPKVGHIGTLEFNRAAEAIAEGRRIVQQALPELNNLIG